MTEKIKKFFKKKKLDANFKLAGPGYRLNDSSSPSLHSSPSEDDYQPLPPRSGPTQETRQAAAAALARLEGKKKETSVNRSFSAIQAQVKREIAAERELELAKAAGQFSISHRKQEVELDLSATLAVSGVYFKCPLIGPQILTREEWNKNIREFLYEQLAEEKGLTACLILHSLNRSQEKVNACVETLIKYMENILQNPGEEKYRKIRMSNRIYQEKVMHMEGALQVLEAAGFEIRKLPYMNGEEDFLVFPEEKVSSSIETLEILIDALKNAEPITLELDRNIQVLLPQQVRDRSELPDAFFNLTVEDIEREQKSRAEAVERSQMLRTKAMREMDEKRDMRKYRFGIIRIRFPEDIFLQGTFGVYEKFSKVIEFVRETLNDETLKFTLSTPLGELHMDENANLLDLKLIPCAVLYFRAEKSSKVLLKPEIMALMQPLTS